MPFNWQQVMERPNHLGGGSGVVGRPNHLDGGGGVVERAKDCNVVLEVLCHRFLERLVNSLRELWPFALHFLQRFSPQHKEHRVFGRQRSRPSILSQAEVEVPEDPTAAVGCDSAPDAQELNAHL
jgi:hypothetical protein